MYIPAHFRETRLNVLHALIREHSFGTLVSHVNGQLFATHLPFLLDPTRGANGTLMAHMARANPHWQQLPRSESLAIFQGPHAYISPAWYVSEETVPTWNYSVVHAYGTATLLDDPERIRALLDETVGTFDTHGWSTARVSDRYVANMARGIVAFEIPIARLEGKRKLGQNRPVDDVDGAVAGLRAIGDVDSLAVAEDMQEAARSRR